MLNILSCIYVYMYIFWKGTMWALILSGRGTQAVDLSPALAQSFYKTVLGIEEVLNVLTIEVNKCICVYIVLY